jgi:RimJ/RimL family protein N-acetyltransferase
MELYRDQRFVVRNFRIGDVEAHAANRNEDSTAEFQSWSLPYPIEKAEESITRFIELAKPTDGESFGYVIADPTTDAFIGDLAVHLEWAGRAAEIGFSLTPKSRGRGIATGAAGFIVQHLFDEVGVKRIHASLHPDNVASMMVLERLGFIYEGTARQSYWVDDVCTDDPQFGLLRNDWDSWNARIQTHPATVELQEVTHLNRDDVFRIESHRSQLRFIAPMANSAAHALAPDLDDNGGRLVPWMRAIVADGIVVGFVMVAEQTSTFPLPMLWRLLIDRTHQRRGIGWKTLDLLARHFKAQGCQQLLVSWVPGRGSPEPMYLRYGFIPTGEVDGDELVASLPL